MIYEIRATVTLELVVKVEAADESLAKLEAISECQEHGEIIDTNAEVL